MTIWSTDIPSRARPPLRAQLILWSVPWCPPCNEMRLTVFDDPRFVDAAPAAADLVYINGDAPGAQRVGEHLSLSGYPTMLLRAAAGRELLRLPHALPVAPFVELLQRGARTTTSLAEKVDRAQAGERLDAGAMTILSHHSWYQDDMTLAGCDAPSFFERLHQQATDTVDRLRLGCAFARAAAQNQSQHDRAAAVLLQTLRDPACSYHVAGAIVVQPLPTVLSLSAPDSSLRADLVQAWQAMLERALADAVLSPTERLIASSALLQMAELRGAAQALRPRFAATVSEVLAAAHTPVERQTAVNMAGHLLNAAGYEGLAYAVFEAEAARATHGAYFMPYLAEMARARGDGEAARIWWRRAFETAIGNVTRFQLGARYVSGLATLGADAGEIAAAAHSVLQDVRGRSGFFYGRAHEGLRQLVATAGKLPLLREIASADTDPTSRARIEALAA